MTDSELLRRYVRDHSETAFGGTGPASHQLDLFGGVAPGERRHPSGGRCNPSGFCRSRPQSRPAHPAHLVDGLVYTSTRFVAANIRRTEQRRSLREQEAHTMNAYFIPRNRTRLGLIRPLLDEAMHSLDDEDREAVLLRHFENRSYAEIGASVWSDGKCRPDAGGARPGKIAQHIRQTRGDFHGDGLAGLLTANAVGAAPAHLAAKGGKRGTDRCGGSGGLSGLIVPNSRQYQKSNWRGQRW